ncbi:hypothetical protein HMPREF1576_00448 [Gardnerella pickettii JCP7719]|uniref:Uncharacterized protein n=2 Tax=Gardnerella pickettii TaxID=2914924 RepID=T2PJG0_9BIFI|nr:hypothetical protein HMPREF1576_00448 [Gardnerella pickettii JCP7719]EPI51230.1 hypothetical protein HMPREF1577_01164 [Gardnerella pickettii JCP8017A]EPI62404.1 hypothetical protein HMPREF1578_00019 [Gardnerella pickettii JCP8017B]
MYEIISKTLIFSASLYVRLQLYILCAKSRMTKSYITKSRITF